MGKVIAVDLDGVVADWNTSMAKLLKSINPTVGAKVDHFSSDFPAVWKWPEHYGYSTEDINRAWQEVKFSGTFWKNLNPYATAWDDLEFLNNVRNRHDIYFVTTRPGDTAKAESEAWLSRHGFACPTVIISADKKAFCQSVQADILIEDKPENLLNQWHRVKGALFMRPYNKGYWGYFDKTVETIREALADVV